MEEKEKYKLFIEPEGVERKPYLIVMCGLQCSGKTTDTNSFLENYKDIVKLSSDDYRLKHPDWDNNHVFSQLYHDANEYLSKGIDVILDATSITIKARKQVFLNIKVPCYKLIRIIATPYNECLKRLRERNASDYPHKVPEEALKRYYYSFEIPFEEEGWDSIVIISNATQENSEIILDKLLKMADGYNQRNKHHTQDLGTHMKIVEQVTKELNCWPIVQKAAKYHDVGKLFTQTIGEDGQAHYYDHANVGTYNLMCSTGIFSFDIDRWYFCNGITLNWLFFINYHMIMHNVKTEKSIKKWTNIFGKDKFEQLQLLNKADNSNHVGGYGNE